MRLLRFALVFAALASVASYGQKAAEPLPKLDHFDPASVDRSVDPCVDFYKFSCGPWLKTNPVPPDQVYWDHGGPLQLWNEMVLKDVLEKASVVSATRTPTQQKIGDYYFACMDEKGLNADTAKLLKPELALIRGMKNKSQMAEVVAHLHQTIPGTWSASDAQTFAPVFGFSGTQDFDDASKVVAGIDQGGMSLPGREFYLENDAKSVEIRSKYEQHIRRMFKLAGENDTQAAANAATVLSMETDFAKVAMDIVKRRDPANLNNKETLAQVEALTPSFEWNTYFRLVSAPSPDHYIVTSPDFFRGLEKMMQSYSLEQWKAYLTWQLLHGSAPYLSDAFVDENFDFFRHTLQGAETNRPRWRRCVSSVDANLGEALGQAYVERAFPPENKVRTEAIVKGIENAMSQDIQQVSWMSPETKKQAQIKLQGVYDKIGYPNKWRDYSSVNIGRASYLENVHAATAFEFQRWLNKIGRPVDRGEWQMTPPTINAYYDPQLNTINFPAGILQPPFYEADMDAAVNYGDTGGTVGHELTHGFDDQGRKFDAAGNLRDWWTANDAKEYDTRGKCISDQYTQDVPEAGPGVRQNGLLTQGEDTADNGGIRLALIALENDLSKEGKSLEDKGADGWTNAQRFFLSYATGWCANIRPEVLRTQVISNPHSANNFRVNNVVSDVPEFGQAFSCKKGQPMVRENACRVW